MSLAEQIRRTLWGILHMTKQDVSAAMEWPVNPEALLVVRLSAVAAAYPLTVQWYRADVQDSGVGIYPLMKFGAWHTHVQSRMQEVGEIPCDVAEEFQRMSCAFFPWDYTYPRGNSVTNEFLYIDLET